MSVRMSLVCTLLILCTFTAVPTLALSENEISIEEALQIAQAVEMDNFTSVVKIVEFWAITGTNLHNSKPSEILINARTGLIQSAMNITPQAIILGENTYEFSGTIYPDSSNFYQTNQSYNGMKIYRNDARYFKIKQAIFIKNEEGFVAYLMTKGPGMTK